MLKLSFSHMRCAHLLILLFAMQLFSWTNLSADPLKIFICLDGTFAAPVTDFATVRKSNFDGSNLSLVRTGSSDFIRGCQFDSTIDKFYLTDLDSSDANYKIYFTNADNSAPIILQAPIPFANPYGILGGFAIDSAARVLYFTDNTNWAVRYASSVNPLVLGPPVQNEPQILETAPGPNITSPFDIELDAVNKKLYVANGSGGITRINIDGSGSETVISGGPGVFGVAVDPAHNQIFYTLDNNQVWTAQLDGTNPTELTDVIGPLSNFSHRRFDIDYDPDTDKIYWVEYADPNPPFGTLATPGKLRRANPNGTNAADVIADLGYRASLFSFQYGTLKPTITAPMNGTAFVTQFPFDYSLGETPASGTVKVSLKQASSVVASFTLLDIEQPVTTVIRPFSNSINQFGFVTAATGFPIAEGTYDIELSYQDAAGNPAATDVATGVTLALPTPTPTITPTSTATNTATQTPSATLTSTPTATIENGGVEPTPLPGATPTVSSNTGCTSAAQLPTLKIKKKKATLTIAATKGIKYKFFAKPVGEPKRKAISGSIKAEKKGKLKFTFGGLKSGVWEFSYSEKVKKLVIQSCPVTGSI